MMYGYDTPIYHRPTRWYSSYILTVDIDIGYRDQEPERVGAEPYFKWGSAIV